MRYKSLKALNFITKDLFCMVMTCRKLKGKFYCPKSPFSQFVLLFKIGVFFFCFFTLVISNVFCLFCPKSHFLIRISEKQNNLLLYYYFEIPFLVFYFLNKQKKVFLPKRYFLLLNIQNYENLLKW